jgi:hypothetical protein
MIFLIHQWWNKILNIGVQEHHLFATRTTIRLINLTSLFAFFPDVSYILMDIFDKEDLGSWLYIVGIGMVFLTFYFHAKFYYLLAKYCFFIHFIMLSTALSIVFGAKLGSEHLLFVACAFTVFALINFTNLSLFLYAVFCVFYLLSIHTNTIAELPWQV